ncbi:MAG: excinuclease ABC subunit UvrA [Chitinophagales bacterium]|nr:excinuclease ABC subunit UvrA [Chitinophagales bacterium]
MEVKEFQPKSKSITELNPRDFIIIKGARTHNLKNVDVAIPRNKLVVMTGVSGSGKSSLTINTLYAEGQRRYVESLSAYARQFLMRMNKPDVDYIKGICPALAIEQKVGTRTTRSSVGSLTEIYDYLRLLYARIGKTISPVSGEEVKKHSVQDVVNYVLSLKAGSRVLILVALEQRKDVPLKKELELLIQKGFTRIHSSGQTFKIEECLEDKEKFKALNPKLVEILIDRIEVKQEDEELAHRIADSVQTAFFEGHGECVIEKLDDTKRKSFSNKFELDGIRFEEPTPNFFNFNNPYGACTKCEGFGTVMGIDEDLVVPNKNLSVYDGAIACWKGEKMGEWLTPLVKSAIKFDFPIHRSHTHLTKAEKQLLWTGNSHFEGLTAFFKYLESKSYKIQYRVMLSRFRGRTKCPDCEGARLRKDAAYVKVNGKSISELLLMQVLDVHVFFKNINLTAHDQQIAKRILIEIKNRLALMEDVGLGYLSLNRLSSTLSGGETQRINLTSALGSNLTDSLYILDEPSVGLHPRDTLRLLKVLKSLRDLGNTVVVVEHEEEIIRAADYIVDMGPLAGTNGGDVVYQGTLKDISRSNKSLTGAYLTGKMKIETPAQRRKGLNFLEIIGATQHNLKDVSVKIPLNTLTAVSGVSGSGKTTLIKQILYPALNSLYGGYGIKPGAHRELKGDIRHLQHVEIVDQNPIGKSSRSNPVTYVKAYDGIRDLYAGQQSSKLKGFQPRHFSFNVEGGRCETCKGEGEITVEMQFLADVHLECEECRGKRFKDEVLEVTYNSKNIFQVLEMTIDEALDFFIEQKNIHETLQPLVDVGLGYVKLGQSSSSLSGGEAQRVKLAYFLGKGNTEGRTLFIFDEPTTGLHFHDIKKLLKSFNALIDKGHSVVVIEHNVEVLKNADWLIDLGPEGGDAGGYLLYQGVPEGITKAEKSYTGIFLQEKLSPT